MKATQIMTALRAHHNQAALVPELTITDHDWLEWINSPSGGKSSRRIDASMFRSLERTAIEIKVSREDFKRDVYEKRAPWMRVVHRFVYVVPAGMTDVAPYRCGLWWVHEDGRVEVKVRADINKTPDPLPQSVVQTMAYRISASSALREAEKFLDTEGMAS